MHFKAKTVWITGASSGIGEQLAYECAQKGSNLIISSTNASKLETIKQKCIEYGAKCHIVPFDLAKPTQIEKAVENVLQLFSKIDVLINNGGISQRALTLETTEEMDRKIMEINFFGTISLTKKVLPVMIENGGGIIAATSSFAGKFGFPLRSSYSASKHALHGFFETLRLEYEKNNIRVTIICPGRINTDISLKALAKGGVAHGVMDKGQAQGMNVEECAHQYIRAIEKNKKEVFIGKKDLLVVYLRQYFPFLFYKIIGKINPT